MRHNEIIYNADCVFLMCGYGYVHVCVCVFIRELEKHRVNSATDIAKKRQEAESAVSIYKKMIRPNDLTDFITELSET